MENAVNGSSTVGGSAVALIIILYFLPSLIARIRGHANGISIFITNLFLGWTFIGWMVAFIWCFTSNVEKKQNEKSTS
ncbi:MAG: superinfection immunity protein [Rickettsiales bacterium]|nr:superinfection immunity protein [Rickettsiales bacterium]